MRHLSTAWAPRAHALLAAGAIVLAGCNSEQADDIVRVTPRDQIPPEATNTASGATALYNGALNNFSVSFSGNAGGTEGISLIGGMMADEWSHSGTFGTRESFDKRAENADNGTVGGVLRFAHRARISAESARDALLASGSTDAGDSRVAEMRAIEAYMYVLMAETWCSGMPYSEVVSGAVVESPPMTAVEAYNGAIARFDAAKAGNAGAGNVILNLARVGKARALMNLGTGSFAAAQAELAAVPDNFVYLAQHSTNGNRNGIFVFNTENERWTMSHLEGTNGLPFRGTSAGGTDNSMADPRVPWERNPANDLGFDGLTPEYNALKWTGWDDDVVVASGTEARLMEAEILLNAGDAAGWLAKLNALRAAGPAGLAPLADPGTPTARQDLQFREKGFWLYGEAHRLGELRRLVRQYNRGAETVFPTGLWAKRNEPYGTDVNFPISTLELANSLYSAAQAAGTINIRGCLSDAA